MNANVYTGLISCETRWLAPTQYSHLILIPQSPNFKHALFPECYRNHTLEHDSDNNSNSAEVMVT